MSTEILQRAASLMRERAEAATDGPWFLTQWSDYGEDGRPVIAGGCGNYVVAEDSGAVGDVEHMASWHPLVALAVADWLVAQAERVEVGFCGKVGEQAIAVAHAYLGEQG